MLPKEIREFEEFLGVPCQPSELGEDEGGNVPPAHILHHPPRLWVIHDRLPRNPGEVIHFLDDPALGLGVSSGAYLVSLRAIAVRLVLGRDPNPDADGSLHGQWMNSSFHVRCKL